MKHIRLLVVLLALLNWSAGPASADWPQVGFDSGRSSFNPNESVLGPNNVADLDVLWKNSVPCAPSWPISANGIVYYGHYCGEFLAVDEDTGVTIWKRSVDRTQSGHAFYDGVVYVTARCTYEPCGTVYAFNAESGATLWTWYSASAYVRNPVVYNGMVYFKVYGDNQYVQVLDAENGQELWSAPDAGAVAVDNGMVYATTNYSTQPNELRVFNAENGNLLWKALVNHSNYLSRPSLGSEYVYVHSGDGYLYAFNASGCGANECLPLWKGLVLGNLDDLQSPAVAEGKVYVGAGDSFYAFSADGCGAAECQPLWDTKIACSYNRSISPSVANGVVYTGCGSNYIYAFDATNGEILWDYYANTSGYTQRGAPAISNGRLFHAATFNFNIYAFEPATPNELALDFGPAGLWDYDGTSWAFISGSNPEGMVGWSGGLAMDFGASGLWNYDGTTWTSISGSNVEYMADWANGLAIDFGASGVWNYDGTTWTFITGSSPEGIAGWSGGLAMDFGASGLRNYDGTTWTFITGSSPEGMLGWSGGLALDFGTSGLWSYNGTIWAFITGSNVEDMADWANGLAINFGASGVWKYDGTAWAFISGLSPEGMVGWYSGLALDFGASGLWSYDGTTWAFISGSDVEDMDDVDLY